MSDPRHDLREHPLQCPFHSGHVNLQSVYLHPTILRQSGTVTVCKPYRSIGKAVFELGTFSYQILVVEGWGGEGEAAETVS